MIKTKQKESAYLDALLKLKMSPQQNLFPTALVLENMRESTKIWFLFINLSFIILTTDLIIVYAPNAKIDKHSWIFRNIHLFGNLLNLTKLNLNHIVRLFFHKELISLCSTQLGRHLRLITVTFW